jgi:DNA invertase Pin-like site-specific DNA recombinase
MITDIRREQMKSKRVALYARVSTLNHGQDPEVQLHELRAYCERRGFQIVGEYVDKGISGSREQRPALDKLMAVCRKRLVDAVVVYRYDRFARSLRQLVNTLEEFRSLGIDFISIHESVDTSTPNGRLVFGIFASIAEFERELIRIECARGWRQRRRRASALVVHEWPWTPRESHPCGVKGVLGLRSPKKLGSAKEPHSV